jgi:hypothetical protein
MHPAWHISWTKSDVPKLTPSPPDLGDEGMLIYTWVPGQTLEKDRDYILLSPTGDGWGGGKNLNVSLFFFLVIGLPIIAAALISACCIWCCVVHRKEKRKRTAAVLAPPQSGLGDGACVEKGPSG